MRVRTISPGTHLSRDFWALNPNDVSPSRVSPQPTATVKEAVWDPRGRGECLWLGDPVWRTLGGQEAAQGEGRMKQSAEGCGCWKEPGPKSLLSSAPCGQPVGRPFPAGTTPIAGVGGRQGRSAKQGQPLGDGSQLAQATFCLYWQGVQRCCHLAEPTPVPFHSILFDIFYYFFWPRHVACGILVPRPGIKPAPPAVEARSPNHWTAREVHLFETLEEQSRPPEARSEGKIGL